MKTGPGIWTSANTALLCFAYGRSWTAASSEVLGTSISTVSRPVHPARLHLWADAAHEALPPHPTSIQ
eukprot:7285580-Pyramimonas_sp.AAC.1